VLSQLRARAAATSLDRLVREATIRHISQAESLDTTNGSDLIVRVALRCRGARAVLVCGIHRDRRGNPYLGLASAADQPGTLGVAVRVDHWTGSTVIQGADAWRLERTLRPTIAAQLANRLDPIDRALAAVLSGGRPSRHSRRRHGRRTRSVRAAQPHLRLVRDPSA
jgi:hypothetical protein